MMREIVPTSQFKRDYKKRSRERALDDLLTTVIDRLLIEAPLPAKFRDHPLKGG
ncbi:MAG: type II toxin-antitoxin system mRNA interferase toxin, RelE/StbE family [Verrucomicrobiota bacterium]